MGVATTVTKATRACLQELPTGLGGVDRVLSLLTGILRHLVGHALEPTGRVLLVLRLVSLLSLISM